MGIPSPCSTKFLKGDKFCEFLFTSLDEVALTTWGLLLKEKEFAPMGANSFL